MKIATEFLVSIFYTTDDGKCNPETSIVSILYFNMNKNG